MASVRTRNARGCGALLRRDILAAATGLLDAADSESEVTLRGIACAAGITAPAIYAHFPDRDAILTEIAEQSWADVVDEIRTRAAVADAPAQRLLVGCRTYVAYAQRFPMRYALMTRTAGGPAATAALTVVTRALANCRTAPGRSDPATAARIAAALSTALHGVAMLNRTDSPSVWLTDVSADDVIDTLVAGAIDQQNKEFP